MTSSPDSAVRVAIHDGIATLTLAMEGVNKINGALLLGLDAALDALEGETLAGIVITSANRDFCVGADLEMIASVRDPQAIYGVCMALNRALRRLETRAPVVAALGGSALGGGYEIALAAHHILLVNDPAVQVGLPEVSLGVIPGGGGTQRLPRRIGLQGAVELIAAGQLCRPAQALAKGLVDELVERSELLDRARAWIAANPRSTQRWDTKGWRWPGVRPGSPEARNLLLAAQAMVAKKTAGAFPAVEAALTVVQDGAAVDFDRAMEIEARAFAALATSDQAKDMIRTLFFHRTAAEKQRGLPRVESDGFRRVAVLGAGMMGAGLAFVCAKAGYEVVLKDVDSGALDRGMAHVGEQIAKLKHLDPAQRETLGARITPALALDALAGVDLVIEAVFEDLALKHRVIREAEPMLAAGGVFASNTSALPITDLAAASEHPERFIGLHYFSPVEKMPLLEIVRGARTDEDTVARCLAFARRIKKTAIVVNDGYGFFTSRVFSAYILEGAQLVAEGHDPVVVEWAARAAGMVVPPLQVFDEVSLTLGAHALAEARSYRGDEVIDGARLVVRMVEAERKGRAHGGGFYDYAEGKRRGIWPGLRELVGVPPVPATVEELSERLMLAQLAEVGRALDEGVVQSWRDAEVGAVLGIGFAPNTGGPLAMMDRRGLPALVAELDRRAAAHGPRYAPSALLRARAATGERFFPG